MAVAAGLRSASGRRHRLQRGALTVAAGTGVVAVSVVATERLPSDSLFAAAALALLLVLPVWMFLSTSYTVTLSVLALYLGLIDGVLKLTLTSPAATLGRDVLLYAIVLGALLRVVSDRRPLRIPPLTSFLAAYAVLVLVQVLNPGTDGLLHGLAAVRPHLEFIPLFFFGYAVMRDPGRLRVYLLLICIVGAANGVVSLIQFSLTPEQLAGWGSGYHDRIYGSDGGLSPRIFADASGEARVRPFGLGADLGAGGYAGMIAVPALLALLATARRRWSGRLAIPLAIGILLAIVTSQSRSAVVAAVVAALAFGILAVASRRRVVALVAVSIVAAMAFAVVSLISSNDSGAALSRYDSISPSQVVGTTLTERQGTFAMIPDYLERFPLGAGLGSVGSATGFARTLTSGEALNGETQFNFLIVELGAMGLVLFAALHLRLLLLTTRLRTIESPELRLLLAGCAAPMFGLAASWPVGPIASASPTAPYFWFTAGVLAFWLITRRRDRGAYSKHEARAG